MTRSSIFRIAAIAALFCALPLQATQPEVSEIQTDEPADEEAVIDSIEAHPEIIHRLSEQDYRDVAEMLDVETAAIKAVVDIEAGRQHQGFVAPGKPLINFDLSMFRQHARRNGVNLAKYSRSHSIVFASPNARRYGSRQNAQHERLRAARSIDERSAIQGTFWGMFQIGGFNWKLCGCSSMQEFVERMSRSERDQLELFAEFLKNTGMDRLLRVKNWAAFARRYNGPSYARRGYHTRMASAYARHKVQERHAAAAAESSETPKETQTN